MASSSQCGLGYCECEVNLRMASIDMSGSLIEAAVRVMRPFADFCVETDVKVVVVMEIGMSLLWSLLLS